MIKNKIPSKKINEPINNPNEKEYNNNSGFYKSLIEQSHIAAAMNEGLTEKEVRQLFDLNK